MGYGNMLSTMRIYVCPKFLHLIELGLYSGDNTYEGGSQLFWEKLTLAVILPLLIQDWLVGCEVPLAQHLDFYELKVTSTSYYILIAYY
jgi:hypothetical protein